MGGLVSKWDIQYCVVQLCVDNHVLTKTVSSDLRDLSDPFLASPARFCQTGTGVLT